MKNYPVPDQAPEYSSRQPVKTVSPKRIYSLLDSAFAGYGLLLIFWFASALLVSGITFQWCSIVLLAGFWLVLTYFALPRLHQMFTTLYLPDYFMARTKTGDGLLGDPVNLALNGSEAEVHAAMRRAGWIQADDITLRSSLGIIRSSVTGKSYPAAPVSDLFLFGRRHDFAYQQEVGANAAQRHHVRFWRVPDGWKLPGGKKVDWLAAGTYDRSVGLSAMTLQITHKIDADIDAERDYIIDTVRYSDPQTSVEVIENFSTPFHDRNGGGDAVMTDGNMPVLIVTGAHDRAQTAGLNLTQKDYLDLPVTTGFMNDELPPKSFNIVGIFLIIEFILCLLPLLSGQAWLPNAGVLPAATIESLSGLVSLIILMVMLHLSVKKYKWPRLLFLIIAATVATFELSALSLVEEASLYTYLEAGISIILVLIFSAPSVRQWSYAIKRRSGNSAIGL